MLCQRKKNETFGALIIDEVLQLRNQGKTQKEIAELFQFRNVKSVTNLLSRYRVQKEERALGSLPKKRGRPSKHEKVETLEEKILRLESENDLLRSFLQRAGKS